MSEKDEKKPNGLSNDDMVSERSVGRRSAIRAIGTAVAGAAVAAVVAIPSEAEAQCTDSDGGRWADRPGFGRRCRRVYVRPRSGLTDRDPSDGVGNGVCAMRGHTDSDAGAGSDPPGRGRGPCH